MQHTKQKGSILRLIGTVKDADGRIVSHFVKDNDIYLWNWAVFWAQLFKMNFCPNDTTQYGYKSVDGVARTTVWSTVYGQGNGNTMESTWKVQIGGASTAPAVTDYVLGSGIQEVTPTLPEIINDGNILKVVFSSTFAFSSQTVVSEIAIKANYVIRNDNAPYLLTRDTFTAQTVPAGGSITLQHELWFNGTPPAA
jgi:hypothetical protein